MNINIEFVQMLKDIVSGLGNEQFKSEHLNYVFVSDIYEYVSNDDLEYALERKEAMSRAYGLCYINKDNGIELLVKENTGITGIATIIHELVHCIDFISLSAHLQETDLRKVQNIAHTRLWSEFHAEYITYAYLIKAFGLSDSPQVVEDMFAEVRKYYEEHNPIMLDDFTDFCVRRFGKYMAILDEDKGIAKLPRPMLYNSDFLKLYSFLYKHRTFDSIKDKLEELKQHFKALENSSRID